MVICRDMGLRPMAKDAICYLVSPLKERLIAYRAVTSPIGSPGWVSSGVPNISLFPPVESLPVDSADRDALWQ